MAKKATKDDLSWFLPHMAKAVQRAENDPTGMMGVRSLKTNKPNKVLNQSIINNYNRWLTGQQPAPWIGMNQPHPDGTAFDPTKMTDFMHRRWAPIGAENDKIDPETGEYMNKPWASNVRSILRRLMGDQLYKQAQELDLVKIQNQGAIV